MWYKSDGCYVCSSYGTSWLQDVYCTVSPICLQEMWKRQQSDAKMAVKSPSLTVHPKPVLTLKLLSVSG